MKHWRVFLCTFVLLSLLNPGYAEPAESDIDIPFEKFMLDNGLTVIVHEDRKAPIVAVGVWYHVGSKDEPQGKTGFAHLFEHIMFEGSEHYNDRFSKPLDQIGVTSLNGTTWLDRTNYFENVPTPALELALWLESDRMGHLLGVVTQEKLDQERGVVQNEKRQGDNQPYGKVYYRILEGLFPPGHPYRHSTIGSMGRRSPVVPGLLRRREYRPGSRRRYRSATRQRTRRQVFRPHPVGTPRHAAQGMDSVAHGEYP